MGGRAPGPGRLRERRRVRWRRAGLPNPTFAQDFSAYPVPGTTAQRWYLGEGGTLSPGAPTAADDAEGSIDSYVVRSVGPPCTSTTGGGAWDQYPKYDWQPPSTAGRCRTCRHLATTETMIGSGSVDLWLRSSALDTDLQVTLTEVRPDGKRCWCRAGGCARPFVRSTRRAHRPPTALTMLEADAAPRPPGSSRRSASRSTRSPTCSGPGRSCG
ncbi:MAG: CocE/NonD family hydrolase C-terminal non-catalytic domain-containing protein [Acidimicrobiales bacterium]